MRKHAAAAVLSLMIAAPEPAAARVSCLLPGIFCVQTYHRHHHKKKNRRVVIKKKVVVKKVVVIRKMHHPVAQPTPAPSHDTPAAPSTPPAPPVQRSPLIFW